MSDRRDNEKESDLPKGVKPPPEITLPKPDGFEKSNQQEQVNAAKAKREREDRKKKKRRHPKDPYKKMNNKKGCGCAGCGCLTILIIFMIPIAFGVWAIQPFAKFEQVTSSESILNVEEAATDPTMYIGEQIIYSAPETSTETAFLGAQVTLSGFFSEKVSIRAHKVTLTEDSIFLKDLDIYALEFENNSQQIEGELTGKIMSQSGE